MKLKRRKGCELKGRERRKSEESGNDGREGKGREVEEKETNGFKSLLVEMEEGK